jgi:N6-adenosine-specific RNA methylase IME4
MAKTTKGKKAAPAKPARAKAPAKPGKATKTPAKKRPAKPVSIKDALAPIAGPAGKAKWQPVLTATESPRRFLSDIKVANRFRRDKGDIAALAASIDARGALLEPIVIAPDGTLIDGERRMLAWEKSKVGNYGKEPIPVSVVDIDSIIAGEYDANEQREAFKPSELVAIKRAIEDKLKAEAAKRKGHGQTAPGRKKTGEVAGQGRAADKVAAAAGASRRTIEKAERVVEAAERDPERFGALKDAMDRTGRVDGPFKRMQVMIATDNLRDAPPPLPGNGPYVAGSIDFPWPHESDADQESIDARGRSLRPYPAMSIDAGEAFMRDKVAPLFGPDATLWFWVTNHHLVNGAAHRLIKALGPDWYASTMLTWEKDKIGRGTILRDKTEHCIPVHRGRPVINCLGEDPPTTSLHAPRRDNSQKPDEFYRLVERVTPAPRYAAIFSTGGEGDLWDGHGDQIDKHAPPADAPAADAEARGPLPLVEQLAIVKAGEGLEKLTAAERDALLVAGLTTGKKAKGLSKLGQEHLASLTEERSRSQMLAELPADFDALADLYRKTLVDFDAAVVAVEKDAVAGLSGFIDLILEKAGMLKAEGEAAADAQKRLALACAAPIGMIPGWGQRGMFRLDIKGVPYIVDYSGRGVCDFAVYAEDATKPFVSETGFHAFFLSRQPALGWPLSAQIEHSICEELDADNIDNPLPSRVYLLPASWDATDPDDGGPLAGTIVTPPASASSSTPAKPKRGGRKPRQLDIEDAIGAEAAP